PVLLRSDQRAPRCARDTLVVPNRPDPPPYRPSSPGPTPPILGIAKTMSRLTHACAGKKSTALFPAGTLLPAVHSASEGDLPPWPKSSSSRSEEHTSELQSRENLVCRLLLEQK